MIWRILAMLLFLPVAALAQTIPAPISDTVNDYADLLPPEAEARVAAVLQAARNETGVHIVLATGERQADYGADGMAIESFGKAWFNAWGIGDKARNDGILILILRSDRVMRIALGSGYDTVWDGRAQRVIDTAFLPAFRDDRYADGIEAGVASAIERLARPYAAREPVTEDSGFPEPYDDNPLLVFFGFVAAALGLNALWAFRHRLSDAWAARGTCPQCGHRGVTVTRKVLTAASTSTAGNGLRQHRCPNCDWRRDEDYSISRIRTSGSSDSGGFGGGSSSGGGASGRW